MTCNAEMQPGTGLPGGALERLALFAEWTGTTPPERITTDDAGADLTFSDDLLIYAHRNGLSLDWLWLGSERSLVMLCHNAALRGAGAMPGSAQTGDLLDARDALADVRAMLDLLFAAGGGIQATGDAVGGAITFGAATAQHALAEAEAKLDSAMKAMERAA